MAGAWWFQFECFLRRDCFVFCLTANDKLSDIEATGGVAAGGGIKGDSEKVTAVKKQLNDLRAIQREMQAIMNETKDQLTREQTQSAVKDKKLQKCYEMIQELENEKQGLNTECR